MAKHHSELVEAGARVVGISVDSPAQNAAMVDKLALGFPLLCDPDGEQAIKPYGLWHDGQSFSKQAVLLVRPDGEEVLRQVGEDFADRLPEEDLVAEVRALNLPATEQDPPELGPVEPGPRAVELSWLPRYLAGAKMGVMALAGRVPAARDDARRMRREYDRFLDALSSLPEHRS